MKTKNIYNEMTSIGIPIDIAICLEPYLKKISSQNQMAFLYWATGMNQTEAARQAGASLRTFKRHLNKIKLALKSQPSVRS
jgi:DNA-directed RNA polymerase specialized sigma24 family protein